MGVVDTPRRRAASIGGAMLGRPVDAVGAVGGGRNSRVFRIAAGGDSFALKQYRRGKDDPRDRQATEADALRLFERAGMDGVPRLVAIDRAAGCSLLTWLSGGPCAGLAIADLARGASFLAEIAALTEAPEFPPDRLASEACLSGAAIVAQIVARLDPLAALADEPELAAFLDRRFRPAFAVAVAVAGARKAAGGGGEDFDAELPPAKRRLCPADFGFHNAIRRPDGSLAFVDFEYFGWDDPAKLCADFLLHPGQALEPARRQQLHRLLVEVYGRSDVRFEARLNLFLPLFRLRWVLILLNEFLPERWLGRCAAGAEGDWRAAKAAQLAKAETMLGEPGEDGWP